MRIGESQVYWVRLPLRHPYSLSFGTLESFDTLMVKIGSGDRTEWGEVVPLPGYSGTSFNETAEAVRSLCQSIKDEDGTTAVETVLSQADNSPFAVSAVAPPLEKLTNRFQTDPCRMPLTGILSSDEGTKDRLSEITKSGFPAVKLKAHGRVNRDAKLVKEVLSNCSLPVRVDANQAYGLEGATEFIERISEHPGHDRIQVFEQPLPTEAWEETEELRDTSAVPIGLDESIWSVQDAKHAADCADVIKLKLAKHGSLERTVNVAEAGFDGDLNVLIGNGVAGELSALYESSVWRECNFENAGENNGFLKYSASVMNEEPTQESGYLIPPETPQVDKSKVIEESVESWTY